MAERSSLKTAAISTPTLTPQGQLAGKPAMPLSRPFTLIGSRNRAHLHLISSSISRTHCCIIVTDNGLYLRDLASRTGAVVNGRKLKESDLRDGDVIQIGSFKFKFADPAGPSRFPITPKAADAVLHFSGVNTEIDSRSLTIGRRSNCDISLDDNGVSSTHAIVFEANGERFIRDLGSRTGTLVNGRPIHHQLLGFGDTIRIGSTDIRYNASDSGELTPEPLDTIEPQREAISLDPIAMEPIELEPIAIEPHDAPPAPAPVFPRMVDVSRRIPLDKDPGDFDDNEDVVGVAAEPQSEESHSGNGTIPIDLEELPAPPPADEFAPDDNLIALKPEADLTSFVPGAVSVTLVPPAPDPRAESIYAMNLSSSAGIFTAATPIEPAEVELAESIAPEEPPLSDAEVETDRIPLEISEPQPIDVGEAQHALPADTDETADTVAATETSEPDFAAAAEKEPELAPEPVEAEPVIEESVFTAPAEVEPEAVAASSTDDATAAETDDFAPTLDVITADLPTPFETLPLTEDGGIAPPVGDIRPPEPIELPPESGAEAYADDEAWTLSVASPEAPTPETPLPEAAAASLEPVDAPVSAPSEASEPSQITTDTASLPGEVEVETSSTAPHPVRPELPPDMEPLSPATELPVAIPLAPAPDMLAAAGAAGAVASGAVLAKVATKRGRGRPKAEPKPAPAPKGGRKKKTPPEPPIIAELPAPVVEPTIVEPAVVEPSIVESSIIESPVVEPPPPAPAASKKRGGSRKKNTPPPIADVPAITEPEPQPVAVDSSVFTPESVDEPVAAIESPNEPAVEPAAVVAEPESVFTADIAIPLEANETQDFTGLMIDAETPPAPAEAAPEIEAVESFSDTGIATTDEAEPSPTPEVESVETPPTTPPPAEATEPDAVVEEPQVLETHSETPEVETATAESIDGVSNVEPEPASTAEREAAPIEVLEPTDPTPESAQVLEPELLAADAEIPEEESQLDQTMVGLSLTDTAFGRAVVDMGSADSASLVEDITPDAADLGAPPAAPEATEDHHLTTAEIPEALQESLDITGLPDEAVGTAANDTLVPTGLDERAPAVAAANVETPDSDFTIPEIDEVAMADLIDDSPEPDIATELVSAVELLPLESPSSPTAAEHEQEISTEVLQEPASHVGDSFDLPDLDLDIDLSGDDESVLGLDDDDLELVMPARTNDGSSLDHAFEPESLSSTNVATTPAPVAPAPAAPAVQPVPRPAPASDPFFGMSRDLSSFLGGVPLTLTSATPIAPVAEAGLNTAFSAGGAIQGLPSTSPSFLKPVLPPQPAPPPSAPPEVDEDDSNIDFSAVDEPLDLFEQSPEKLDEMPDSLAPISDVSNVLSPAAKPAPTAPPTPPPAPPARPPSIPEKLTSPQTAMRSVTPPPPPRSSPLRSFTTNVGVTPPPMVPGAGSPASFGGAPGAAGLTAPFGALGTPQTRQVDVFSHTAFPPLDPSVFSAPLRPAVPRPFNAPAVAPPGDVDDVDDEEETSTADDVLSIEADSLPDLSTTPLRRTAIPPNQQAPTVRAPLAPVKKPWWKSLKILLPLLIVAIIVVILVVMFFPPKHTVQGTLQIRGLDSSDQGQRRSQVVAFRNLITDPHVRQIAASNVNLKEQGLSPGFLNDPLGMSALASSATSPFDDSRGQLLLNRVTTDVPGDSKRMAALLDAIFAESGEMNSRARIMQAGRERQAKEEAEQEKQRQAVQVTIDGLARQLAASGGISATNWLLNPQTAVTQLLANDADAQQAADAAAADVQSKRQALQAAQAAVAPLDASVAAESRRVKKAIADLNVRLEAIRMAQTGNVDESAKRFASSLDGIDKTLNDAAGGTLAPAPVTDARNAVAGIRELDSNLAAKLRDDSKTVAQLRRQIADRREAHLRQIWSGDTSLQALTEERNAQSHRYGAAIDSNYVDEAAKIKGVLEDLDHKIEARRSELATGDQFADQLQQTLQKTIDRTEAARQAGEAEMTQKLQGLAAMFSGNGAASIPDAPKLAQAASDVLVAREAYGMASSLSATTVDAEARRLQLQIAEQQARLDSLHKDPGNSGPIETARQALDVAQAAEAKATAAATTIHNNLVLLQQLAAAHSKLDSLTESLKLAQNTAGDSVAAPELVKPDEASISPIYARDQRFIYLIAGLAVVALVFALPFWLTIHDTSHERHAVAQARPLIEPLNEAGAPTLISSDRDSLFEADAVHA